MEYLEHDFAQIEHVNQIIANNISHDSWECFDTTELIRQQPLFGVYNEDNPEESTITLSPNDPTGLTPSAYENIRYNSLLVSISAVLSGDNKEEYYVYRFEVRNSLWTGNFVLSKTRKGTDGEYETFDKKEVTQKSVDGTSGNIIEFYIKGNDRKHIRVCFQMSMAGNGRKIEIENLQLELETETEFEHQYDEEVIEPGMVRYNTREPASNVILSLKPCDKSGQELTEGIPPQTLSKGQIAGGHFRMPYGATKKPGIYYCLMEARSSEVFLQDAPSVTKLIKVHKVQDEQFVIDWGEEEQYEMVWRGCKKKYHINFGLLDKYGKQSKHEEKLKDTFVNVSFIKSNGKRDTALRVQVQEEGTKNNEQYYIEFTINYRKYYEPTSSLEISFDSTAGFGDITTVRMIKHPWFVAQNYNEIISQLYLTNNNGEYIDTKGNKTTNPIENPYGVDWICLRKDVEYNVTTPLLINRDLTLEGLSDSRTSRIMLNGNGKNIIRTYNGDTVVSKLIKVNLVGIGFTNAECAIYVGSGTRLLVDRCYFTNNRNESRHHRGSSIFMPWTDWSVKNKSLWKTEIRNSYFVNNKGNEIQSVGSTKITGNLFKTTDSSFLQQPEVKVVAVRAGTVEYTYNKSYINTGSVPMKSNHSYAKALAYVESGATFNGRGPSGLWGDMTLPLYGKYNNQAYTYSIYYYPYGNVRTEIVCSPRSGYERQATGHGSTAKNWIFYDGYYFVRWEKGRNKGNRKNPWTEEELTVPRDLGVHNTVGEKWLDGYDPRFSGAKSVTSSFD